MTTPVTHKNADTLPWKTLVDTAYEEITKQIQRNNPELFKNTFLEPIKFLPHTPLSRKVVERWLQLEENRTGIAHICGIDSEDVTNNCLESSAPFICLKVDKPGQISKPVPDKTLVFIAIGQLYPGNGMFTKVNLSSGQHFILSGNETQIFQGKLKGGGLGVILRLKFKTKS